VSDPLANIVPGSYSPFVTRADTVNAVLEAVRRERQRERGQGGGSPVVDSGAPATLVWVRNDTGSTLPERSVVKLGTPVISASTFPLDVQRQPVFPGTAPAAATDPFAVLLEPAAASELVLAAVLGVAVCDVTVTSAAHGYAGPSAGATASLSSVPCGPAQVIWRAGGTGTQRAVVLLTGANNCYGSSGYDPTPDDTKETDDPRVIRTVYQMYDGKPTVLETRQNCVTSRNSSGQVLTIVCDPPVTTRQSIDPCLFTACCDGASLTVTVGATPDHGTAPLAVAFSATATGSHTYLWQFGDGASSTSEDPSHTFTSPGLYIVVLTVDDCRQERVPVAVAPADCSCPACDPTEETSAPPTRTLAFEGGTGEWADLNGTWTLYRTGGCLWQWWRDDWKVSQDYDGGHLQVTAVNDATGTQATWRNTAVADDCCSPANDMELVSRTPPVIGDDIPTFVPADEVYTTDSCDPCEVTVGCGTFPRTLYFHTTSCACIGIGVDSVAVVYDAAGADGAGWYMTPIAGCVTSNALNIWFKCVDTGGGVYAFRVYESCGGSGTANGTVAGTDFATGAAVTIPTDGVCCLVTTTGTLKTTP
jgi:hypothetical protein